MRRNAGKGLMMFGKGSNFWTLVVKRRDECLRVIRRGEKQALTKTRIWVART